MGSQNDLGNQAERQAQRMKKAEHERSTLLGQTVYIGTLGLLFVLPMVGGAYFGRWLDSLVAGYSVRWTMSFIFIGVMIGAINVYLFIKD